MSRVEAQLEPLRASKRRLAFGLTVLPQPTALIYSPLEVVHIKYIGCFAWRSMPI
jgi:hypothetical protein